MWPRRPWLLGVALLGTALLGAAALPGVVGPRLPGSLQTPIMVDADSGCSCKWLEPSVVICFDLLACARFPGNITVPTARGVAGQDTATLFVKGTRIEVLAAGDLARLTHLTGMFLDYSRRLTLLEPGAFQGMRHLVNLSVSYNKGLTHLHADALVGLESLRELTMIRNGFATLAADVTPALRPGALPQLLVLALDENDLGEVAVGDFQPMDGAPLQQLSLTRCGLAAVRREWLAPLRQLAVLRLADNNLDLAELAASLPRDGAALRTLDISGVGLSLGRHGAGSAAPDTAATSSSVDETTLFDPTTTPTVSMSEATAPPDVHQDLLHAIARSRVEHLVLKYNKIERLWPSLFPCMPRLRSLDLSHVGLTQGLAGALAADVLPALQVLDLSFNRLRGLRPGFVSDELLSLDLSHSLADYFDMGEGSFRGMRLLRELRLSYNRVMRLDNQSLLGLDSLEVLSLRNATIFKLDDGVFAPLRSLQRLDLTRNHFPKFHPMRPDMFLGLGRLQVLLLGSCGLRSLDDDVFRHLAGLRHLDLQDNALATLDGSQAFRSLRALQILDLSRNRVGSWHTARLFGHNEALREVRAAGNTFTYLSEAMLLDLGRLSVADLADNTFHCGCDMVRPPRALIDNNTALLAYKCLSPDRWRDHSLAEYVRWASSHAACMTASNATSTTTAPAAPAPLLAVVLPPVALLLLVLATLAGLAYRYRHTLRLHWDTARNKRVAAGGETNYQYDAFVSYSSEDQAFVHKLVAELEGGEPRLRLCVYERDFAVGATIAEEVLCGVAKSRRVLLLVSAAFARSHWCAWETHLAHHRRLQSEDALLVVRLGAVDEALLTPMLRYLMLTRIYLEWPRQPHDGRLQQTFWRKLRAALA